MVSIRNIHNVKRFLVCLNYLVLHLEVEEHRCIGYDRNKREITGGHRQHGNCFTDKTGRTSCGWPSCQGRRRRQCAQGCRGRYSDSIQS